MELLREIMPSGKLTNLQMELLKVFNKDLPDHQVLEIRSLLADYFMQKADDEMNHLEAINGWTADTYKQWAGEHWRHKSTK
jgi:hypothetical protein